MSTPIDRRARKRLATRQAISDAATLLFLERGFDAVTMDEIAEAADVGRMTVFNHFPRKEDLFFDREEEGRTLLREAVARRRPGVSPLEALRRLAHRLVAERYDAIRFFDGSRRYVETIRGSETLRARARAIRDEFADAVRLALAGGAGRPGDDPQAHLAAALLMAGWSVAFADAHRRFRGDGDAAAAEAFLLAVVDSTALAVAAALAGSPYVEPGPVEPRPVESNPAGPGPG